MTSAPSSSLAARHARRPRRPAGFTLLEMMLSVAVFLLLATAAFSLVGSATELMTEISEVQNESNDRLRFVEACRAAFESMTARSSLEFHYFDRGGDRFDTYLVLVNAPEAFDFGASLRDDIERVAIAAEFRPDGFIRSRVYYFTAAAFAEASASDFSAIVAPHVDLAPRMRQLSWRFLDRRSGAWRTVLEPGGDPSLVELLIRTDAPGPPLRSVFWLPAPGGPAPAPSDAPVEPPPPAEPEPEP